MAKDAVDRIVAMLSSEGLDRRVAAAIVLGELGDKRPEVVSALAAALAQDNTALREHVLSALARLGAKKAVPAILPLLVARDAGVRAAAIEALVGVGESLVPELEARHAEASAEERRALDEVLARLGGKEAFGALLAALESADEEAANRAAVAMRQQVRDADAKTRRGYLTQLEKVLAKQEKAKGEVNHAVVKAALKMLGYLEDERASDTLLRHATAKKQPPAVRQEALIALRFIHKEKTPDAKLIHALVAAAGDEDRTLAQAALITLSGMDIPARSADRLEPLLSHPDLERARFVIDMLSHRKSDDALAILTQVVATAEPRRARIAADALMGRKEAAPHLAAALIASDDRERGHLLARVLAPMAGELAPPLRKKLLAAATARLAAGENGWQATLDIVRSADPAQAAQALRELYATLKRRQPAERATEVLKLLCRGREASDEDRYELASRILAASRKDTSAAARKNDESLRLLGQLVAAGYDVASALRRDRAADLDALYYVGFHFIEEGHPVGEELLGQVVEKGGRKKIATMAKNKLELAGA
jgi:HEAT repeat protein